MITIDTTQYCILAGQVKGHRHEKCPQCKAIRILAITVQNQVLEDVIAAFERVPDGQYLDPKKTTDRLRGMKTHPENIG